MVLKANIKIERQSHAMTLAMSAAMRAGLTVIDGRTSAADALDFGQAEQVFKRVFGFIRGGNAGTKLQSGTRTVIWRAPLVQHLSSKLDAFQSSG